MAFDFIIKGGEVVDGSGKKPRYKADVGIKGDRISAIGSLDDVETGEIIDVTGHIVCPGFIDVHIHSENTLLGGRDQMAAIQQGVTTQLLAPDGFGWSGITAEQAEPLWRYTQFAYGDPRFPVNWPTIESYLDLFPGRSPANVMPQVPHCAIRIKAMGWAARHATPDELKVMEDETRAWMEAGASCLCLGLDYQPSANASFDELMALSKIALEYDGIYAAHLRYQILGRPEAWQEIINLNKESGIPVHVSHERVDDITGPILDIVDQEGVDLSFESYLYPAGMTHITMLMPMWVQEGSLEEVLERMKDNDVREKTITYLREKNAVGDRNVVGYTKSGRFTGLTLSEAARSENKSNEDFAYDLVLEEDGIQAFVSYWPTPPEDNEKTLEQTSRHPRMMLASDGIYDCPHPHPRGKGCFTQMLRKFVREKKILNVEEAVYKMSGYPADRYRLKDRGLLAEGRPADVVIFNHETVSDGATFEKPLENPKGVPYVFVNGSPVIKAGLPTENRPGQVLGRR